MARSRVATPRDRFDDVPEDLLRAGAHRAPERRRGWITFAWAALATGVLVGAGIAGLTLIEDRVGTGTGGGTRTVAAGPAPTVDPSAQVVVLNATTTGGLAASAADMATSDGWTVASTANADSQDVATSTVYFTEASQEGAALGLAASLGIEDTARSKQFVVPGESRLTVVLGADYEPAG